MQPYVVCIKQEISYSKVIFVESEEEGLKEAGKLSCLFKASPSHGVSVDTENINTEIFLLDQE